ncbi:transposase [Streptomyces sp. APSN-46.1]|uniref:transposase n=1 Tax=Streptomyces sp. APSN-46.1 TaxID=2929049 RepID=UPI0035ABE5CA
MRGWCGGGRSSAGDQVSGRGAGYISRAARPFCSDHRIIGLVVSLTDVQWARIEPLLPDRTLQRGGQWRDHRQVIHAITWKCRTRSPWVELPAEFGSWAPATACGNGRSTEHGSGCSPRCSPRPTRPKISTGSWRPTRPSSVRISTPPGPVKGPSRPASATAVPSDAPAED